MKTIERNPKAKAAKASLEKMLELIGPYLPTPDARPQHEGTTWTLEGSNDRPKQSQEKRKELNWSAI